MSGLEIFLDGGATVASLTTAALGALGYKQNKDDSRDLAKPSELEELRAKLQAAHAKAADWHGALTNAWRGPLSLFGERDAERAAAAGVPAWAVACVRKGRRLVVRAAELEDLADVYASQLGLALGEGRRGKGLLRAPPLLLVERLLDLAQRLEVHVPYMQLARAAFDSPADAEPQGAALQPGDDEAAGSEQAAQGWQASSSAEEAESLPIAILRNRGVLGELWRLQGQKIQKLSALRAAGGSEADALLPPEVRRKLADLRSEDQYEAMAAAWALGRLGAESAPEGEGEAGAAALQDAVREAAAMALRAAASGCEGGPHESVREAALQALERLLGPEAAAAAAAAPRGAAPCLEEEPEESVAI